MTRIPVSVVLYLLLVGTVVLAGQRTEPENVRDQKIGDSKSDGAERDDAKRDDFAQEHGIPASAPRDFEPLEAKLLELEASYEERGEDSPIWRRADEPSLGSAAPLQTAPPPVAPTQRSQGCRSGGPPPSAIILSMFFAMLGRRRRAMVAGLLALVGCRASLEAPSEPEERPSATPQVDAKDRTKLVLAAASRHTCLLRDDPRPTLVPGLVGARQLVAQGREGCALDAEDRMTCFSGDYTRESWTENARFRETLFSVREAPGVATIGFRPKESIYGQDLVWARLDDGRVGLRPARPQWVRGVPPAKAMAETESETCIADEIGDVHCWPHDSVGSPEGTTADTSTHFEELVGIPNPYLLQTSQALSCAVVSGGRVVCWDRSSTPAVVPGLVDPVVLEVAEHHACGIDREGAVYCWGEPGPGRFGPIDYAVMGSRQDNAQRVAGIDDAIDVALGTNFTCVARRRGPLSCRGSDPYGMGIHEPIARMEAHRFVAIDAYDNVVCGVTKGGEVHCDVPFGSDFNHVWPRPPEGLSSVVAIAMGEKAGCVLQGPDALRCWGANDHGQLGDGRPLVALRPIEIGTATLPAIDPPLVSSSAAIVSLPDPQ